MQVKIPWDDENIDQFIIGLGDNVSLTRFFTTSKSIEVFRRLSLIFFWCAANDE